MLEDANTCVFPAQDDILGVKEETAHLLQFGQCPLTDAGIVKIVLGCLDDFFDDLGVNVALSPSCQPGVFAHARPSLLAPGFTYHQMVRHLVAWTARDRNRYADKRCCRVGG